MLSCHFAMVVAAAALAAGSPARMFFGPRSRSSAYDAVTTVDCSNREAVAFVAKMHTNFRCVFPEDSRRFYETRTAARPFPLGIQTASFLKEETGECEPGLLFSPEVSKCLEIPKGSNIAPLESDSLIIENPVLEITSFSSDAQSKSDCKSNEIYNEFLALCMTIENRRGVEPLTSLSLVRGREPVSLEVTSFDSPIQTAEDCQYGEIYVPYINGCVSVNAEIPLQSASFVQSSAFDKVRKRPNSAKDCKDDEGFNSEISLCFQINPPKVMRPLSSGSLVKEPVRVLRPYEDKVVCREGEILAPSIGICQPARPSQNKPIRPASSSLVKEPTTLEIQSFKDTKDSESCPPGSFFNPSVDKCLFR